MTDQTVFKKNDVVWYHGSLTERHGLYRVAEDGKESAYDARTRYTLNQVVPPGIDDFVKGGWRGEGKLTGVDPAGMTMFRDVDLDAPFVPGYYQNIHNGGILKVTRHGSLLVPRNWRRVNVTPVED